MSEALWLLGETSKEEEGKAEEPETSTPKQDRFNWDCIWMEEGVHWHWTESESQRLLAQVFSSKPLSLLFCLALYWSVLAHGHILVTWSSCFFSGAVPIASNQFSVVGGRMAKGLHTNRVSGGMFWGQGPVQHPLRGHDPARAFHICWPTSTQDAQVDAYCNGLMSESPRGQSSLTCSPTPRGDIPT